MSFILDALKKSESDRQRQNGPALFEVKVAPRRMHLPLWAIAIALLLGVNLIIVLWMLLRHPLAHAETAAAAASTPAPAVAAAPSTAAAPTPPAVPLASPPGVSTGAALPAPGAPVMAPATTLPAGASNAPVAEEQNSEDFAPAAEPTPMLGSHVKRGTADGVPLYQDVATPGNHLPPLRLDLHVFALRPQDRFVMINMKKLREGDALPEGVHVEVITPDGVVLSYGGSRFMLPKE